MFVEHQKGNLVARTPLVTTAKNVTLECTKTV